MMAFSGAMTKLILNVGVGKYRLSMVDAGMRQLNETTCTIEFVWWLLVLCKHLLISGSGAKHFAENYWIMRCLPM
jgi:hypothetical protein